MQARVEEARRESGVKVKRRQRLTQVHQPASMAVSLSSAPPDADVEADYPDVRQPHGKPC